MTDLGFTIHPATDKGRRREANEDNLFAGSTVFAVADGMGGHVAGEVASKKALEPVASLDGRQFADDEEAQAALAEAIVEANRSVVADAAADRNLQGMGTTLTAVMVRGGRLHLAHVGDSRAYLLRQGAQISQLTTDHTLVEQLVREGRLSREQAATHPQRSVITRAIGIEHDVDVDSFAPMELRPGDQVVLCSDGLTDAPVTDEEIAAILEAQSDGDTAARQLIAKANERGGPDNITVVLLRVAGASERAAATATTGGADRAAGTPPVSDPATQAVSESAPIPVGPTQRLDEPPPRPPVRTSAGAKPISTRQESGTDVDWAERMGRYGDEQGADGPPARRKRGRILAIGVGVLVLLGLLGAGGYALLARAYFVGDDDGRIAIFNGLPEVVAGLPLYWERERTDLATDDLPGFQAQRIRAGVPVPTLAEARATVDRFREAIDDSEETEPEPGTSPEPTESETADESETDAETEPPPTSGGSPTP